MVEKGALREVFSLILGNSPPLMCRGGDLPLEEEALAADLAGKVGLDFDDGLHYYVAKKLDAAIVSYDRDFNGVEGVKRVF